MTQMNRGEAIRCIQIAKKCIQENKIAKAEKFLNKSLRMYETVEAKQLLQSLKTNYSQSPPNTAPNTNPNPTPTPTATPNRNTSASASTPNLNRNSTASASTSSIGSQSSSRMSRDEEVSMIRKILRAKDFYSILDVPKDANDKQLKKAYRKLALKCHPDRNKAPGAEEAFKKLSKAYDCLREPRQRQIYDQYGEDSPQMRGGRSAQFQQMTPDDIIRMFFGGDFGGGHHSGFHFHTGGFPQRRHANRGSEAGMQAGPMGHIMQLLPIILVFFTMILPSLMMFGGSSSSNSSSGGGLFSGSRNNGNLENTYFSLNKQHPFTLEKKTNLGTVYYTQPQRRGTWGYQRYKPHRLEQQVESTYLNRLIGECEKQMEKENGRIERIQSNKINGKQRQKLLKKLMKNKRKLGKWENKQCKKLFEYVGDL